MPLADSKTKKITHNQATVILIALAVVVWVVGLIVSKSVLDIIMFNNRLIGRKRQVESTLQHNLDTVDELTTNYDNLQTRGVTSTRVLNAIPDKLDVPGLASRIEGLIRASSLNFESFGLAPSSTPVATPATDSTGQPTTPTIKELVFTIQVSGPYKSMKAMLSNFEREITPMRITEINITGSEQNAQATLKITSYYKDRITLDVPKEVIK